MSKIFNSLDSQFEHYLDNIALDVTDNELTPKLKAERRFKADSDDFDFCKIYFPQIFSEPFNDLHHYIKNAAEGIHGISGCRLFGKSAFTYCAKYIKPVAIGGFKLIGVGLRTQKHAIKRAEALHRLMLRNKKLCYDYDINFQQDRQGDYIINNMQVYTFGAEEGLRNFTSDEFKRFHIIILDDLYNRLSVSSTPDNERILDFVLSEVSGQLEAGGIGYWLYNMISEDSPGKQYANDHPELCFNLPALNDSGQTNWEGSKWTTEALKLKEESLPYDVWMGDWMNDPQILGNNFSADWLRTININHINVIAALTAVDPSYGESPQACFKAAITMGYTDKRQTVILDIYVRKEPYNLFFNYLAAVRKSFPNYKAILWENDFNQWSLALPYYQRWVEENNKYLPIVVFSAKNLTTAHYGADKSGRIMNLVHPFSSGTLLLEDNVIKTQDYNIFKSQYLAFGKKKGKLDGLDAAATAYIMLPRYIHSGSFKPLKDRRHAQKFQQERSWLHNR